MARGDTRGLWSRRWFRALCALSLLANLGLFLVLFTPLTAWMHRALDAGSGPVRSQAVVVLSSVFPFDTENGMPGLSTMARLDKGLELYRAGLADTIIVLGGTRLPRSGKTLGQVMRERLLLAGVPDQDIIVQDAVAGSWGYYDNLMQLIETRSDRFDFSQVMFVTSMEQSWRIRQCLETRIDNPRVVLSEPYELAADWGRRFQLFRRAANEMLVAIPLFYLSGRFDAPGDSGTEEP